MTSVDEEVVRFTVVVYCCHEFTEGHRKASSAWGYVKQELTKIGTWGRCDSGMAFSSFYGRMT